MRRKVSSQPLVTVLDFGSTLHRFHQQHNYRQAFPKAAYVHPATMRELKEHTPEYAVEADADHLYIHGVEILPDRTLELDVIHFVVPSYLMVKVLNQQTCPILTDKPEYNGSDRRE